MKKTKLCTGKEAAEILRRFEKMTTPQERRLMAEGIEDLRVRMNCDLPDDPEWDKLRTLSVKQRIKNFASIPGRSERYAAPRGELKRRRGQVSPARRSHLIRTIITAHGWATELAL